MRKLKKYWFGALKEGWKDKGEVPGRYERSTAGGDIYTYMTCSICRTKVNIAVRNEDTIFFCPACLTVHSTDLE